MGTRFNVLMTIQVPLKQKPQPKPRGMTYGMGGGMGMLLGGMGGGMKKSMPMPQMSMMKCAAASARGWTHTCPPLWTRMTT